MTAADAACACARSFALQPQQQLSRLTPLLLSLSASASSSTATSYRGSYLCSAIMFASASAAAAAAPAAQPHRRDAWCASFSVNPPSPAARTSHAAWPLRAFTSSHEAERSFERGFDHEKRTMKRACVDCFERRCKRVVRKHRWLVMPRLLLRLRVCFLRATGRLAAQLLVFPAEADEQMRDAILLRGIGQLLVHVSRHVAE